RAIDDRGVLTHGPSGPVTLPADTVVTAFGVRPNVMLTGPSALEDPRVHLVGDCLEPAKVGDAIHAGFRVAQSL
ncbi:MAG TPA: NADH:flavin oxidoreductase, partial [Actinotalea sp.]